MDKQISIFDYDEPNKALKVLQSLRARIEWNYDHATTNVARYTYETVLEYIDEEIEKERK